MTIQSQVFSMIVLTLKITAMDQSLPPRNLIMLVFVTHCEA